MNGVVTAYPAVHLVLAGTIRLEEMLGESDLEGHCSANSGAWLSRSTRL